MTELLEVVVDHLGSRGDGVVLQPGGRLFVDGALAGERVLVRSRPGERAGDGRAELVQILEPSADRVLPPCPHAVECGGCRLQHLGLPAYARFLEDKVRSALGARGLATAELCAAELSPPGSRRRVRFAWQRTSGRTLVGMRMEHSNRIVDLATCLVAEPGLVALLPVLRVLFGRLAPTSGEVALDLTEAGVDVLIAAGKAPTNADRAQVAAMLPELPTVCRLSWRVANQREAEPLLTRQEPFLRHGPVRIPLVPGGFRQATAHAETVMRRFLDQHLAGAKQLADLFGGTGALGLALQPLPRKLVVIEADAAAAGALASGLGSGVKGSHVTVLRRDLHAEPLSAKELRDVDAVILDPPRAGARAQCETLSASRVPMIGYVSCDPGSFARDARTLVDGGYRLKSVQPIGQFLWSDELELAAAFSRDPP